MKRMMMLAAAAFSVALAATGDVVVKTERLNPADAKWNFKTIPRPSKSDAANGAKVEFVGNAPDRQSGAPTGLTDGILPRVGNHPAGYSFFSNENSAPGSMLMDLGRATAIAQINSYSWHEHPPAQGARAPQVFALYGSAAANPDPKNPSAPEWTKIADVDTRPNKTGEDWGGQYGTSIGDAGKTIGTFRWLLWVSQATMSPKESPVHTHSFFCELDVHTPETLAKAGDAELAEQRLKEIVVVFKTHFDIGYHDFPSNIVKRYQTSFTDGALKLIDASRKLPADLQFTWTIPGWPMEQMAGPGQTPERRERALQAIKEGRFAVHALPFSIQTESLDLEDLVRGLTFSADLARSVGIEIPRAAKMTDVPCHTWVIPTLLKHAGVNFLHIGCNGASHNIAVPPLYWWEGPDGSRVLTAFSGDYGTGLFPPDSWPYRTWLAMEMTGDNQGPPTDAQVENIRGRVAKQFPDVKLKFGKMEDFYDAIIAEHNTNIPVVRADTPDTWIHGFESMPIETKVAWNTRPLETTAGILDTQLRAAGLSSPTPLAPQLAKAYEQSLLYGEHTFGMYGSSPGGFWYGDAWKKERANGRYKRFEAIFDAKRDYAHYAARIATNAVAERMTMLAKNVAFDGPRVVVFNPLPWKRSGNVETPNGLFFAKDVPACGYRTYTRPKSYDASSDAATMIKNYFFRLRVDPSTGGIFSLTDAKTGRGLIANRTGQYLHERFCATNVMAFYHAYAKVPTSWAVNDFGKPGMPGVDKSPYAQIVLTNWNVSHQQSALANSITLRCDNAAPLAKSVTLKYTLYNERPYLDVEWRIDDKTPDPMPEGGWLAFPFAIEKPVFKLTRVGSIIDPAMDIIAGGNRTLLCLNSSMTVTGPDGYGVGLCPLDSPLVSLGEPGLWRYSDTYIPTAANVFVNLYNNEWNTNFPLWQDGSWNSVVRIWVVNAADGAEKNLITPGWESRSPLIADIADGPGGKLPAENSGLSLSRRGVLVTAFGPDPYSDKTVLRLWEQAGESGACEVILPAGMRASHAIPVNLRGEPAGDAIAISGGAFRVRLSAFAPASFRLE